MFLLILILLLVLVYGPQIWVRYVIRKHSKQLEGMPGTGSELALHLIDRFNLTGVVVEQASDKENYYSPADKVVALEPEVYNGKSLSAIAIAAHEVGHAIQYHNSEPVSQLRGRYTGLASRIQSIGISNSLQPTSDWNRNKNTSFNDNYIGNWHRYDARFGSFICDDLTRRV